MKLVSGPRIVAIIFMMVWFVRFVVALYLDVKGTFETGPNSVDDFQSKAHSAISAVWSLSPSAHPGLIFASYSIAALVSILSIKLGLNLAAAQGSNAVDRRVLICGSLGIAILIAASAVSIVTIPESWLPGRMAEIRFTGIPLTIMVAEMLLAHAAGLEVGAVRSREAEAS